MNYHLIATFIILTTGLVIASPEGKTLIGAKLAEARNAIVADARKAATEMATDFAANRVTLNDEVLRYTVKDYGTKPVDGWPLIISLHGGGTCPAAVNDQQWRNQQYRYDAVLTTHASTLPCRYIAPRAARDVEPWHPHCFPLLSRLIFQEVLFGNVDPNKVYIMGYSEGGYACYRILPSFVDRLAGIAAGGAADKLELAPAENLMNCAFNIQVGEYDNGYGRRMLAGLYRDRLQTLKASQADTNAYIHAVTIHKGFGHDAPDYRGEHAGPLFLLKQTRNPFPKKINLYQGDWQPATHMYWLGIPAADAVKHTFLSASVDGNTISVIASSNKTFTFYLDDALVDLNKKITVVINGDTVFNGYVARDGENLKKSWEARHDPAYIVPALLTVTAP